MDDTHDRLQLAWDRLGEYAWRAMAAASLLQIDLGPGTRLQKRRARVRVEGRTKRKVAVLRNLRQARQTHSTYLLNVQYRNKQQRSQRRRNRK